MKNLVMACGLVLVSSSIASAQSYVQTYRPVFTPAPTVTYYAPAPGCSAPQATPAYYRGITAPVTAYYTPGSFLDRGAIPMTTAYVRESVVYRPGAVYRNGTFLAPPGFYQPAYNVHP
jgi:hypothetical protein